MENEYDYDDDVEQNEYTIWWVNTLYEINSYTTRATDEKEAIIDFFTHGAEPQDVENYEIEIKYIGE